MSKKFFLGLLVFLFVIIGGSLYRFLTTRAPYYIISPPKNLNQVTDKPNAQSFRFSYDADTFSCQLITPKKTANGYLILLLHGVGGSKADMHNMALALAERGYHAVIYDSRAHGFSTGKYCTYGYHEKHDLQHLINYLYAKPELKNLKYGLWGCSMGGAVALQTLAIEPRLKFGIIQSTFSSLEQIVYDYQQRALNGWGTHWSAHLALNSAGKLAQFDPYTVKPIEAVKQIKQPVVICHGDQDIHIPVSNGQDLFNNLKSSRKELIIVKGANHYNLGQIAGYKFYDRMNDFILSVK